MPEADDLGRARVRFERREVADDRPSPNGALRRTIRARDGERVAVDFTNVDHPDLARALLWALADRSTYFSKSTLTNYTRSLRRFFSYLSAVNCEADLSVSAMKPGLLDGFEDWLTAGQHDARTVRYSLGDVIRLFRWLDESDQQVWFVSTTLRDRLLFVSRDPIGARRQRAPGGYSHEVASLIRRACIRDIQCTLRRIQVTGRQLLSSGRDPERYGWDKTENLLWYIDRNGPFPVGRFRELAGFGVEWPVLRSTHRFLFPSSRDLLPCAVLLALDTGIEPTCLKNLPDNCLADGDRGRAVLKYWKPRAGRWIVQPVRSAGSSTPGGVLRIVQGLTGSLRRWAAPEERGFLWLHYQWSHGVRRAFFDGPLRKRFVHEHGLADSSGSPVELTLNQARKTYESYRYIGARGAIEDAAGGRKRDGTFLDHYGDTETLRETHEASILRGLHAAANLARSRSQVEPKCAHSATPRTETWLAGCEDPYESPYAKPGEFCGDPFMGCLDCANAAITLAHLPAHLQLLDRMLEQRRLIPAEQWAQRFGRPYTFIVRDVLPRFTEAALLEARTIAEASTDLVYLPPEFYSRSL